MSQKDWTRVDNYFVQKLIGQDQVLEQVLQNSETAGLPPINVTPTQGRLLQLLATAVGAKRILEIGTLGGYSAICLARGMPDGGRLITLEFEPAHARVARADIELAGLADRIEIRGGRALDSLEQMKKDGAPSFDLVFIDADKSNHPAYLEYAIGFSHPGTLILGDNVVREGQVANAKSRDASIRGVRKFIERLGSDSRIVATAIQTVGTKGYDGFAIGVVR